MGNFITDLKNRFLRGDISLQFIYINVGIFVVTTLISVFLLLFNWNASSWLNWLELPAWIPQLLAQPWSLFTYMFFHAGALHLLFNMLWLYWFGQLFLSFFSARHYRGLYLLGGLCGGLFYLLAFNVFPYFESYVYGSYLLGASAVTGLRPGFSPPAQTYASTATGRTVCPTPSTSRSNTSKAKPSHTGFPISGSVSRQEAPAHLDPSTRAT